MIDDIKKQGEGAWKYQNNAQRKIWETTRARSILIHETERATHLNVLESRVILLHGCLEQSLASVSTVDFRAVILLEDNKEPKLGTDFGGKIRRLLHELLGRGNTTREAFHHIESSVELCLRGLLYQEADNKIKR